MAAPTILGPRGLAVRALGLWERKQGKPADLAAGLLSRHPLPPADARLMSQLVFGVIRHRRLLDTLLARHLRQPGRLPGPVSEVLRVGALQLLLLDRVPDHAAVHTAVELARALAGDRMAALVNAVLRKVGAGAPPLGELPPAVRLSFPDWMAERWRARLGADEAEALMRAQNEHPPPNLRVNTLVADRESAAASLAGDGLPCRPGRWAPQCLVPQGDAPLEPLPSFAAGLVSVQDEAFQLVGSLLPLRPADLALDAFAGLGGKATQLAQRSADRASVLAADLDTGKLARLVKECRRLRARSVSPVAAHAARPPFRAEAFDAVLLDAPCSATGIIRRHPDVKWNRRPGDIPRLAAEQLGYLREAARLLRPGGSLLYATCSLEPEENEGVVLQFLSECANFKVARLGEGLVRPDFLTPEGFFRSWPHRHGTDGAFAALLVKR